MELRVSAIDGEYKGADGSSLLPPQQRSVAMQTLSNTLICFAALLCLSIATYAANSPTSSSSSKQIRLFGKDMQPGQPSTPSSHAGPSHGGRVVHNVPSSSSSDSASGGINLFGHEVRPKPLAGGASRPQRDSSSSSSSSFRVFGNHRVSEHVISAHRQQHAVRTSEQPTLSLGLPGQSGARGGGQSSHSPVSGNKRKLDQIFTPQQIAALRQYARARMQPRETLNLMKR